MSEPQAGRFADAQRSQDRVDGADILMEYGEPQISEGDRGGKHGHGEQRAEGALAANRSVEKQGEAQPEADGEHDAAHDEEDGDPCRIEEPIVAKSPDVVLQANKLPGFTHPSIGEAEGQRADKRIDGKSQHPEDAGQNEKKLDFAPGLHIASCATLAGSPRRRKRRGDPGQLDCDGMVSGWAARHHPKRWIRACSRWSPGRP